MVTEKTLKFARYAIYMQMDSDSKNANLADPDFVLLTLWRLRRHGPT